MATLPRPPATAVTREALRASGASDAPGRDTRLTGRRLVLARLAWGAFASLLVGLNVLFLPAYWAQLRTVCTGVRCALAQPSPTSASALQSLGLSVAGYAELTLAASLLSSLICFVVAGVIIWRKSNDWMALVVALAVVALGTALAPNQLETGRTVWQRPALIVDALNFTLLFLLAVLFPSGRFVPRWIRWLVIGWVVAGVGITSAWLVSDALWYDGYQAIWVGAAAGVLVAQVYRYRAVSGPRERAQTRWVVLGGGAAVATAIALTAPVLLVPALSRPGAPFQLLAPPIGALVITAFSVSLGIAILRHRLYDIDVIIRRTVIYALVTGALAALYTGCILGTQAVAQAVRGGRQPLNSAVVAASTLLVAALFLPLRRRVQTAVDRRFYRRKYDAARTLEAFGRTLRTELDPVQLGDKLLATVRETMQPERASLWTVRPARPQGQGQGQGEPGAGLRAEAEAEAEAAWGHKPLPLAGPLVASDWPTG